MHYLLYLIGFGGLYTFLFVPQADTGAAFMMFIGFGILGLFAQAFHQDSEAREAKLRQQVWDVARAYEEESSESKSNQSKVEPNTHSNRFILSKWHLTYGDTEISVDALRIEIRDGVEGVTALHGYSLPGGREWISKQEIIGDFNYLYQTSASDRLWSTNASADGVKFDTKKGADIEMTPGKGSFHASVVVPSMQPNKKSAAKAGQEISCISCKFSGKRTTYLKSPVGKECVKCPQCGMNFEPRRVGI